MEIKLDSQVEGSAARGGHTGDLYVVIQVTHNEIFERDGRDLYFEAPPPIRSCCIRGTINVPGLESKIALKIPSYTQTGKILGLKAKVLLQFEIREEVIFYRVVVETRKSLKTKDI